MKRFILTALLALSFAGSAVAAGIPIVVSPTSEPEVWTTSVFNNSGGALTSGTVVIWDWDSSTGDDLSYVTTTATASSPYIAGVVYQDSIATASVGEIAIRGVVPTKVVDGQCTAGDLIGTGTTTGFGANLLVNAEDLITLGLCVKNNTASGANWFVFVNPGMGGGE